MPAVLALGAPCFAQGSFPEVAKLQPAGLSPGHQFGTSVATDGDVVVAGAPGHAGSGAAFAFRFDGSAWLLDATLIAADAAANDRAGAAVAVHQDVAVVGVPMDDDLGSSSGAAIVFRHDGSAWQQEQKLLAGDGLAFDQFGGAVAIHDDVVCVGASLRDAGGTNRGAVYVFRHDGSAWVQEAVLVASNGAAGDLFGQRLASGQDLVAVGAPRHDGAAADGGAAYVYRFDGAGWVEETRLSPADLAAGDQLGGSVALFDDVLAVGAAFQDGGGADEGAVYLYRDSGAAWVEEQKLVAGGAVAGDQLGNSVGVMQDLVIAGGVGLDDAGTNAGAAVVFEFDGSTWSESARFAGSDTVNGDSFGAAVAAGTRVLVAGAPLDDDLGSTSGAAFLFQSPAPPPPPPSQDPTLVVDPTQVMAGEDVEVTVSGGTPGGLLLLLVTEVNGRAGHFVLTVGRFDQDGELHRTARAPRLRHDLSLVLQGVAFTPPGPPVRTNEATLEVMARWQSKRHDRGGHSRCR